MKKLQAENFSTFPDSSTAEVEGANDSETSLIEGRPLSRKKPHKIMSKLKVLRKSQGLTLEELSDLTKISPSYLSRLEAGARRLNTDLIQRLAAVFNCSPAELLDSQPGIKNLIHPHFTQSVSQDQGQLGKDLPVYNVQAAQGVKPSAFTIDMDRPIKWTHRPLQLDQIHTAFAVVLRSEACEPKYHTNDLLLIHPSKPLSEGCSLLCVSQNNGVTIGQFERWRDEQLEVRPYHQTKSAEVIRLAKVSLKGVYRIIGCFEDI